MKHQLLTIAEGIILKRRVVIRQKSINELNINTHRRLPYKRRDDYLNTKIEETLGDYQTGLRSTSKLIDIFAIKKEIRKNNQILDKRDQEQYEKKLKFLMESRRAREEKLENNSQQD